MEETKQALREGVGTPNDPIRYYPGARATLSLEDFYVRHSWLCSDPTTKPRRGLDGQPLPPRRFVTEEQARHSMSVSNSTAKAGGF
jgi:hypothetical protein